MLISIIIPTKDRNEVFKATLRSAVEAIEQMDAEIIVVNDSKSSRPVIPENFKKVKLVDNPKSGVASARNTGVKESTGELLLFLDNDILISSNSIQHICKLHRQMKDICLNLNWEYPVDLREKLGMTQFGRFMKEHRLTSFKGWYSDPSWKDNSLFLSKSVASFHLSMSRSNFNKTKGYNEQFPHAGFEDYDFPVKLKEAGLVFYIDSRVTVFHNEADRMSLEDWLNSQQRRANTRKVAVDLGYGELRLSYGLLKKMLLSIATTNLNLLYGFLKSIPNNRSLDPLYFRLLSIMQASKIYKGYTS